MDRVRPTNTKPQKRKFFEYDDEETEVKTPSRRRREQGPVMAAGIPTPNFAIKILGSKQKKKALFDVCLFDADPAPS
ncbi:hypothetical protein GJ744_010490 [Endocarpon pusillum]|uniref:Uncharacterized protein n=1 Tax=Endocarpon pusillum TaxID=364733 RepID=A0A8H7E5F1_9EURO|nr:hypothetical protein GJ744_010490 [Endocarpon pusillum]